MEQELKDINTRLNQHEEALNLETCKTCKKLFQNTEARIEDGVKQCQNCITQEWIEKQENTKTEGKIMEEAISEYKETLRASAGFIPKKPILILNCAILTAHGTFYYMPITLDKAKVYIKENGFISAVGHQATAQILTELLEVEIPQNRIQAKQEDGQMAIVFAMNQRIAEGVILDRKEIEQIGYTLNLLEKDV